MTDSLEARLKNRAHELGFSLAGIAPATEADGFDRFSAWLDAGYSGEMTYLDKRREEHRHPCSIVADVRSVLMLALDYTSEPVEPNLGFGTVAKYARGPDYHRFIWDRQNELATWFMNQAPGYHAFGVADTAPLLERDFARRAGLGWFGKNTMLINKHRGSFFFLGALLTDCELQPGPPFAKTHCGTCTACLDTCPTQAFLEPGTLDARRCISYLTIEHRSSIPLDLREPIGDWLFGCDICQDVCPWNRHAPEGPSGLPFDPSFAQFDPVEILRLTEPEFRQRFRHTSLFRAKRSGLRRNAAIVLGNTGTDHAIPALQEAAEDENPIVQEAAKWALTQIQARHKPCGSTE